MSSSFLFHRPVAANSKSEIYETAHEILSAADFMQIVGKDALHLTLLSERMLRNRKMPRRFIPYYQVYEASRRDFISKDTTPWEQTDIARSGLSAIFGALVINTVKPEWLSRERNAARKVAGITSGQLAFNNRDYNPHVTVGRFIGTAQDWAGFYECERLLQKTGCGAGTVTLGPVRLDYGEHSWEFQPRQLPIPSIEVPESA